MIFLGNDRMALIGPYEPGEIGAMQTGKRWLGLDVGRGTQNTRTVYAIRADHIEIARERLARQLAREKVRR